LDEPSGPFVLLEGLLLGVSLVLAVLTGLGHGSAWPWVVILGRWISTEVKVAVGSLMLCWWAMTRLSTGSTCGSGSYDINGQKGVIPSQCEVLYTGPPPVIVYGLLALIIAILLTGAASRGLPGRDKTPT
jgi:hypothetical protein